MILPPNMDDLCTVLGVAFLLTELLHEFFNELFKAVEPAVGRLSYHNRVSPTRVWTNMWHHTGIDKRFTPPALTNILTLSSGTPESPYFPTVVGILILVEKSAPAMRRLNFDCEIRAACLYGLEMLSTADAVISGVDTGI
jgi:hypothetical protein